MGHKKAKIRRKKKKKKKKAEKYRGEPLAPITTWDFHGYKISSIH